MDAELGWREWKRWLARAVEAGRSAGIGSREIVANAARIGDFLARNVDPANPQQRLLKELWMAADETEQRAIASALVKLVDRDRRAEEEAPGGGFTLT